MFPDGGPGACPVLDIYKVEMPDEKMTQPMPDRRQLILYRLLHPLPESDINSHVLCHAFGADKNGLLMAANHLNWGEETDGTIASLSYSFYVHVNAEDAVMKDGAWWVQEVTWPRADACRVMMESRIWSPEGVHVATAFQDGVVRPGKDLLNAKL